MNEDKLDYLTGFGNLHASEARANTLPHKQNSPQSLNNNLIAEQLSGSAFTRTRANNLKSWLYKEIPSASLSNFNLSETQWDLSVHTPQAPNQYRWQKPEIKQTSHFISGTLPIAINSLNRLYTYEFSALENDSFYCNSDGEFLFINYQGSLLFTTEFGKLQLNPCEIVVIPRGVYFSVQPLNDSACGYLCDNQGEPLQLPELGVIGANGLAHPRHFKYPKAIAPLAKNRAKVYFKQKDVWWETKSPQSPINTVAWHGNYAPYKYSLMDFNTINTVSFDHPDPSIFTVLTSASQTKGVANLDFVIFPERWMCAEHTFRPPYFHRNVMSEFMGLLKGRYDAKNEGFSVGGYSIHNAMIGHGPDYDSFKVGTELDTNQPERYKDTLAFMLESNECWQYIENEPTRAAFDKDYTKSWTPFL